MLYFVYLDIYIIYYEIGRLGHLSAKPSYHYHVARLPLASSLHEVQPGQGFSLLLCVDSPVLLAGTAVFLPYRSR